MKIDATKTNRETPAEGGPSSKGPYYAQIPIELLRR